MYRWMDVKMDEWIDGNGCMIVDGCMDDNECKNGWMIMNVKWMDDNGCMDVQSWMDG